jgi:hypothetical protein
MTVGAFGHHHQRPFDFDQSAFKQQQQQHRCASAAAAGTNEHQIPTQLTT